MVEYDVVVVGAGILGLSTAYHIKKMHPKSKIIVIDRLNAAGQANTAKSGSAFRCLFSSNTNYALADSSIEFYNHLQEDLDIDLKLQWIGYLWLLSKEEYREMLPVLEGLRGRGFEYQEYDGDELTSKLSMQTNLSVDEEAQLMGLEDIYKGFYIPKAGVVDADYLVRFYETEFSRLGGEIQYSVEVKNLIVEPAQPLCVPGEPYFWQDARINGVNTTKGKIKAKKTVLAAGVWTPQLMDAVGIECYIKPKKRQLFCVEAKTSSLQKLLYTEGFNTVGCLPFTILPKPMVYIRPFPGEGVFWLGFADEFPRAFKLEEEPQPEKKFYQYGIYQVLVKYFAQFRDCRPSSAFAGLYEINTLDGQPIIFEENELIVVGGASGSGIMKADAIGRIAAALYKNEIYASLYGDRQFRVSDLSLKNRCVELEKLVI
ncbi:MAG: FAD-binding oxidoreductase [Candidatus Bathyarchaeota archaeon]|jgi:glycine/D-amino acid oxidase-like deaminating enzyme